MYFKDDGTPVFETKEEFDAELVHNRLPEQLRAVTTIEEVRSWVDMPMMTVEDNPDEPSAIERLLDELDQQRSAS